MVKLDRLIVFFLALTVCLLTIVGTASGVTDPGAVTNPYSTSHVISTPSKAMQITMTWSAPADYASTDLKGYLTGFSTSSTETLRTGTPRYKDTRTVTSSSLGDGTYYFHVAAVDIEGDAGTTTSVGPFIIDTAAPTNTSATVSSETTSTLSITLTLGATNASQMNVSNTSYGAGTWETYATSKSWTLTTGEGQKTIYVQFRDSAGNTANASATITYQAGSLTVTASSHVSAGKMPVGTTVTFTATGGSGAFTYTIVAATDLGFDETTNTTGVFTPTATGTFSVKATDTSDDSITGSSDDVEVTQTTISPTTAVTLLVGATQQFTVDGGKETYAWSSSDTDVGTVNQQSGLFRAVGAGTCTVTVADARSYTAISGTITVGTMVISPNEKIMVTDATQDFSVSGGTEPYEWTPSAGAGTVSGSTPYATVTFTASSTAGDYSISVEEDGGGTASTGTIQVVNPIVVSAKGEAGDATVTTAIGGAFQLTVTGGTGNDTNTNYTWSSSNTSVATVDSSGNLTAQSVGLCTITATDKNETSISDTSPPIQVVGEINSLSISLNEDNQCVLTWTAPGGTFNVYYNVLATASVSEYTQQLGSDITETVSAETYSYTDTTSTSTDARFYLIKLKGTDISKTGVGMIKLSLSEGFNLVSCPLMREDTDVNSVIGNQLTEGALPTLADRIHLFTGSGYEWTYLKTGGIWSDWPSQAATTKTITPDKGYWIEVLAGHGVQDVYLVGGVPSEAQTFTINPGFNLIGNPYPFYIPLTSANFNYSASGGQAGVLPTLADKIHFFTGTGYEWAYLKSGGSADTWSEWPTQDATTRSIEAGDAVWVETLRSEAWTWTLYAP